MPLELPPNRIVTLDSRIFGAHTLPHKKHLGYSSGSYRLRKTTWQNDVKSRFSLVYLI